MKLSAMHITVCIVFLTMFSWTDTTALAGSTSTIPPGVYVSVANGSDRNPGTFEQPFRTIQKAISQLSEGGTCYLMEGTYREEVRNSSIKAGAGSPLVIRFR